MTDPSERHEIARRVIAEWRALPEAERRRIRRSVIIDQVASSMAMAGEPVSPEWIAEAKLERAQREQAELEQTTLLESPADD